jgi:hypothetical protein
VEFRGYVPEEAIPDLFRTSTIVVMPYDSATGSSGPAHQACEYGVPIVCADIDDFQNMATDEEMAVNFYKVGDAADLANQLTSILESPEQQHRMAERNFSAAMQMTMTRVVRNYLRWFDLKKCKEEIGSPPLFADWRTALRRSVVTRLGVFSAGSTFSADFFGEDRKSRDRRPSLEAAEKSSQSLGLSDSEGWPRSETAVGESDPA